MSFTTSKVTVVGRLGADAQLRQASGKSVCDFRFCANVYRGQGKEEAAVWYKTAVWEKFADAIAPQLVKGAMVYVHGDLIMEEYADKEGVMRNQLVILMPDVIVLGGKKEEQQSSGGASKPSPFRDR